MVERVLVSGFRYTVNMLSLRDTSIGFLEAERWRLSGLPYQECGHWQCSKVKSSGSGAGLPAFKC